MTAEDGVEEGQSKLIRQPLLCLIVFVAHTLWVGYASTKGLQASDSSEFVLAAVQDIRIHPPGYPLLSLWGSLFQWCSDNPIWNTALAMGVLHSIALVFVFDALTRLFKRGAIALWVTSILAVQPLWIRYSTIPEAFPALSLVYAGLFWLLIQQQYARWHSFLFGGLLCLGLGTHHLFVLALPMILLLVWRYRQSWWIWLIGVGLGLCSYGLLWNEEHTGWSWGQIRDVPDLIRYFLRTDYGTFQITHHANAGTWWGTPVEYLKTLVLESWCVFCLGLLGVVLPIRNVQQCFRFELLMTILSWLFASIGVLALFGLQTDSTHLAHSNRFFVASMVLWMPFVGMGCCWVFERISFWTRDFTILFWLIPLVMFSQHHVMAGRFDTRMQRWLDHSCQMFPKDALVFVAGDGAVFGSVLGQELLGQCQQVQFVFPRLLGYDWYQYQIRSNGLSGHTMLEVLQHHTGPAFTVLGLVGEVDDSLDRTEVALPPYVPFGGYWMQFIPVNQAIPLPSQVEAHLSEMAPSIEIPMLTHHMWVEQSAEQWPLEQWGHSWLALAAAYKAEGNTERAEWCLNYGNQWLPTQQ